MSKEWISMEKVISSNTNQEIIKELYIDGTTAKYTQRMKEINAAIAREKAEKEQKMRER